MSDVRQKAKAVCYLERINYVNQLTVKVYFDTAASGAAAFVKMMEEHPMDGVTLFSCDEYEEAQEGDAVIEEQHGCAVPKLHIGF